MGNKNSPYEIDPRIVTELVVKIEALQKGFDEFKVYFKDHSERMIKSEMSNKEQSLHLAKLDQDVRSYNVELQKLKEEKKYQEGRMGVIIGIISGVSLFLLSSVWDYIKTQF